MYSIHTRNVKVFSFSLTFWYTAIGKQRNRSTNKIHPSSLVTIWHSTFNIEIYVSYIFSYYMTKLNISFEWEQQQKWNRLLWIGKFGKLWLSGERVWGKNSCKHSEGGRVANTRRRGMVECNRKLATMIRPGCGWELVCCWMMQDFA